MKQLEAENAELKAQAKTSAGSATASSEPGGSQGEAKFLLCSVDLIIEYRFHRTAFKTFFLFV